MISSAQVCKICQGAAEKNSKQSQNWSVPWQRHKRNEVLFLSSFCHFLTLHCEFSTVIKCFLLLKVCIDLIYNQDGSVLLLSQTWHLNAHALSCTTKNTEQFMWGAWRDLWGRWWTQKWKTVSIHPPCSSLSGVISLHYKWNDFPFTSVYFRLLI